MEPLSAISLAGTVLSFVDFASKLIGKASEIYESANGITDDEDSLDVVYERLSECSSKLAVSRFNIYTGNEAWAQHHGAIRALAESCDGDCNEMLTIIEKLKDSRRTQDSDGAAKRRWKSFQGALKSMLESKNLRGLERRLQRVQSTLTLHLCAVSTYVFSYNSSYCAPGWSATCH